MTIFDKKKKFKHFVVIDTDIYICKELQVHNMLRLLEKYEHSSQANCYLVIKQKKIDAKNSYLDHKSRK
jgi:hypothetical protein